MRTALVLLLALGVTNLATAALVARCVRRARPSPELAGSAAVEVAAPPMGAVTAGDDRQEQVARFAQALAAGDLSARCLPIDDHDRLGVGLTQVAMNVSGTVRASQEVMGRAGALADRVQQSASAAATNAELSTRTAHELAQVRQGFDEMRGSLEAAARVVHEVVGAADEIVRLADGIEDISDQTRLLALNATIEAARAGEAGRGFAVVADGVRSLANETARTARAVAGIVAELRAASTGAATSVDAGSAQAGATFEVLVRADGDFAALGREITSLSVELAAADDDIRAIEAASTFVVEGSVQGKLRRDAGLLRSAVAGRGGFGLLPTATSLLATDQATGAELRAQVRPLALDGRVEALADVVDAVTATAGAKATVFRRLNDAGDMVRVATSVRRTDGSRATGTAITAVDAAGRANPVLTAVLQGRAFEGVAKVLGDWYLARYEPITIAGEVVGMVFVGDC